MSVHQYKTYTTEGATKTATISSVQKFNKTTPSYFDEEIVNISSNFDLVQDSSWSAPGIPRRHKQQLVQNTFSMSHQEDMTLGSMRSPNTNLFSIYPPQDQSTNEMDTIPKLDLDTEKWIEEICSSDLHTPDITDICDQIASNLNCEEGFNWNEEELLSKNTVMRNPPMEEPPIFGLSPRTLDYYKGDSLSNSDNMNDSVSDSNKFTEFEDRFTFDNSNQEVVDASAPEDNYKPMHINNYFPLDEEALRQPENTRLNTIDYNSIVSEENNASNNSFNLNFLQNLNSNIALDSGSNILETALHQVGLQEYNCSTTEDIDRKVDSFLNADFFQQGQSSLVGGTPSPKDLEKETIEASENVQIKINCKRFTTPAPPIKIVIKSRMNATKPLFNVKNTLVEPQKIVIRTANGKCLNLEDQELHGQKNKVKTTPQCSPIKFSVPQPMLKKEILSHPSVSRISVRRQNSSRSKSFTNVLSTPGVEQRKETPPPVKRKRESCKGLSDAEKFRRCREQNNRASKKCRERRKMTFQMMVTEVEILEKQNYALRCKKERITEDVDRWKRLLKSLFKGKGQ